MLSIFTIGLDIVGELSILTIEFDSVEKLMPLKFCSSRCVTNTQVETSHPAVLNLARVAPQLRSNLRLRRESMSSRDLIENFTGVPFTSAREVLRQRRNDHFQGYSLVTASTANGIALHVSPMGFDAGRFVVSDITGSSIRVIAMVSTPVYPTPL